MSDSARYQQIDAGHSARSSGIDPAGLILRVRRSRDMSQRELAAAIGIDQSQVARMESSRRRVDVDTLERILAVGGMRFTVVDDAGAEVIPVPFDVLRDNADRRYPAHLDVQALDHPNLPLLLRGHRDRAEPVATFRHRRLRDRRRRDLCAAFGEVGAPDHPTQRDARRAADDRREMRRVAAMRSSDLLDDDCSCTPECFRAPRCTRSCECRCES